MSPQLDPQKQLSGGPNSRDDGRTIPKPLFQALRAPEASHGLYFSKRWSSEQLRRLNWGSLRMRSFENWYITQIRKVTTKTCSRSQKLWILACSGTRSTGKAQFYKIWQFSSHVLGYSCSVTTFRPQVVGPWSFEAAVLWLCGTSNTWTKNGDWPVGVKKTVAQNFFKPLAKIVHAKRKDFWIYLGGHFEVLDHHVETCGSMFPNLMHASLDGATRSESSWNMIQLVIEK